MLTVLFDKESNLGEFLSVPWQGSTVPPSRGGPDHS